MNVSHIRLLFCVVVLLAVACQPKKQPTVQHVPSPLELLYDSSLRPFYHGVASGDPLHDRVIIWTRVTPSDTAAAIEVHWEMSEDDTFAQVLKQGQVTASGEHDFTIKVDVDGLQPGRFYFYRFQALGRTSITGRTKTAVDGPADSLRFAVVSCSNWEFGYFNAYDRIAEKEVDALLHLGDYIYEYGNGTYGDTTIGRKHQPAYEIVSLSDYRTRYAQYHLDAGLRHVRQRHPLIAIWDDHEVANNVYTAGAENHQDAEGDFMKRKAAARQAYYEWIPIREDAEHYRSFSFGKLADVIMLDERLAGRTKPSDSLSAPDYAREDRSMLGTAQRQWLQDQLKESGASWKILGNQVMFSELDLSPVYSKMPRNLDAWDGYPADKRALTQYIRQHHVANVVFLTGDTHASWAVEVPADPLNQKQGPALAVEFGTTSVSSGNGDDGRYGIPSDSVKKREQRVMAANPHVKYVNDREHGYLLLTVYPDQVKADWFYVNTLRRPDDGEYRGKTFSAQKGKNVLVEGR